MLIIENSHSGNKMVAVLDQYFLCAVLLLPPPLSLMQLMC